MADFLASIIIPVNSPTDALAHCLAAIESQSHERREVVLVCTASAADDTRIPKPSKALHVVKEAADATMGRMINAGMRLARGHVKIMLRPDCVPEGQEWIERMLAPFEDKEVGVVVSACKWHHRTGPDMEERLVHAAARTPSCVTDSQDGKLDCVSHVADAYRAEILADLGYFEYESLRSPGEAIDLALRVADAGYSIVAAPGASVVRHVQGERRGVGDALKRAVDYGYSDALLESHHGIRWLNAGLFAAALCSLFLLPVAAFSMKVATVLSLGLLVWGFFLGLRLPLLGWEMPVAALNFLVWALIVHLIRDDWWPGLFGTQTHPAIIRQWCWLGAVTGSYLLIVAKAATVTAVRILRRPGGTRYAIPVLGVSGMWWLMAGLGYAHGRLAGTSTSD